MAEQFPQTPQNEREHAIHPELQRQQNVIRDMIASRVSTVPLHEQYADSLAESFGLEAGRYDAYDDMASGPEGHFLKFVSREDPTDIVAGYTTVTVGGPTNNLNRSVYNRALRSNGDLIHKVSTENMDGQTTFGQSYPAENTMEYGDRLGYFLADTQRIIYANSIPETQEQGKAKSSKLRRLLGRSTLRSK